MQRAAIPVAWIIDEDGNLAPEYAPGYHTIGVRDRDEQQLDLDRIEAFAKQVPTV